MQYTAFVSVVLPLGLADPALAQNASWKSPTFRSSKTILPNKGRGTSCCLNAQSCIWSLPAIAVI